MTARRKNFTAQRNAMSSVHMTINALNLESLNLIIIIVVQLEEDGTSMACLVEFS